jgi:hypothetical protein
MFVLGLIYLVWADQAYEPIKTPTNLYIHTDSSGRRRSEICVTASPGSRNPGGAARRRRAGRLRASAIQLFNRSTASSSSAVNIPFRSTLHTPSSLSSEDADYGVVWRRSFLRHQRNSSQGCFLSPWRCSPRSVRTFSTNSIQLGLGLGFINVLPVCYNSQGHMSSDDGQVEGVWFVTTAKLLHQVDGQCAAPCNEGGGEPEALLLHHRRHGWKLLPLVLSLSLLRRRPALSSTPLTTPKRPGPYDQ